MPSGEPSMSALKSPTLTNKHIILRSLVRLKKLTQLQNWLYRIFLQVIAVRTFLDLFLRVAHYRYTMWITLIAIWSLVGAVVIAGPATASGNHGPFCEHFHRIIYVALIDVNTVV